MKRLVKACSCFLASMLLSCSIFCSYSVPVHAAAAISLPRCIDLILTNQGIVANQTSLSSIGDVLVDTLDTSMKGYITYCNENGLDWREKESYTLWKENTNFVNALLDAIIKNRQNKGDDGTLTDTDVVDVLVEPNGTTNNVIPKSMQQPVVDAYKQWWEDCGGYYNVWIPSYKELVGYCYNTTAYDNLAYLTSKHDFVHVDSLGNYWDSSKFRFVDLDSNDCMVYAGINTSFGFKYTFYDNWIAKKTLGQQATSSSGTVAKILNTFMFDDSTTFATYSMNDEAYVSNIGTGGSFTSYYYGLVSHDGKYAKIWKSLESFKAYSVGVQNVYYSPNHSTTVSNDITVTTDYITTYANQYSYSTVQQQIDNSSEVTEETVNSIVGSTITNITNNYYYTSPGTGTDGTTSGGDSSDDGLLNGGDYDGLFNGLLGNLLSLVSELIEFVVKFFVKGLELISGGFTAILNLLNSMTDSIGGLGELIGAFFPFVPQEFFDLMFAGMSVLVGIAIYRALRG